MILFWFVCMHGISTQVVIHCLLLFKNGIFGQMIILVRCEISVNTLAVEGEGMVSKNELKTFQVHFYCIN